jgi:putative membrane protein
MTSYYWNDWYSGFGYVLWFGLIVLLFSGLGNWGYTYRAHRRFAAFAGPKDALDILDERYARGDITREQYSAMKSEIAVSHQQLRRA